VAERCTSGDTRTRTGGRPAVRTSVSLQAGAAAQGRGSATSGEAQQAGSALASPFPLPPGDGWVAGPATCVTHGLPCGSMREAARATAKARSSRSRRSHADPATAIRETHDGRAPPARASACFSSRDAERNRADLTADLPGGVPRRMDVDVRTARLRAARTELCNVAVLRTPLRHGPQSGTATGTDLRAAPDVDVRDPSAC
jgi:hypothetical protein